MQTIKVLESPSKQFRLSILQRPDGTFCYRPEREVNTYGGYGWVYVTNPPERGSFAFADDAEREAQVNFPWPESEQLEP